MTTHTSTPLAATLSALATRQAAESRWEAEDEAFRADFPDWEDREGFGVRFIGERDVADADEDTLVGRYGSDDSGRWVRALGPEPVILD